jgi:hypothetical protein
MFKGTKSCALAPLPQIFHNFTSLKRFRANADKRAPAFYRSQTYRSSYGSWTIAGPGHKASLGPVGCRDRNAASVWSYFRLQNFANAVGWHTVKSGDNPYGQAFQTAAIRCGDIFQAYNHNSSAKIELKPAPLSSAILLRAGKI